MGCSEKATFDLTFKMSIKQTYLETCDYNDTQCIENINQQFETCFKQTNYNTEDMYQVSIKAVDPEFKSLLSEKEILSFVTFSEVLESCMARSIKTDNSKASTNRRNKDITITQPTKNQENPKSLLETFA